MNLKRNTETATAGNVVKHVDHLNLSVKNLDESLAFYNELFGFVVVESGKQEEVRWAIIRAGDAMLCIYEHADYALPTRADTTQRHSLNHFALRILDEDVFKTRAQKVGVTIRYGGQIDWPHSRSWYLLDPTGYEIEVVKWNDDVVAFA